MSEEKVEAKKSSEPLNDKWKYVFAGVGVVLLLSAIFVWKQAPKEANIAVQTAYEETKRDAAETASKLNAILAIIMSQNCYADELGVYGFNPRDSGREIISCTGSRSDIYFVRKTYPTSVK